MTDFHAPAGKLIIFSAPSGSGKTTIVRWLAERFPQLEFSVSATSRPPRCGEKEGRDYYFLSPQQFRAAVSDGLFVEWEEVYPGTCYGTLRSEIERIWRAGRTIVFDVDVRGGLNLKKLFGDRALAVFVMPPSLDELRRRLERRGTESPERVECRLEKASDEISYAGSFDMVVVNDGLEKALEECQSLVGNFLSET